MLEKLNLNGKWSMRSTDEQARHEALVPGSVYADYMRDGTIDDPFWRENERAAFELMRKDYEYRREFDVPASLLAKSRVLLCCEGLDTLANVYINGLLIGEADNMHVAWEWDVRHALKEGANEIVIRFMSPIEYSLAEYEKRPLWCSTDAIPGYPHLRKAHCMFGWDWGPRLPDAGIWRSISLIGVDEARIISVLVSQEHENGAVRLSLTPELEAASPADCAIEAELVTPDGERLAFEDNELTVADPKLWWPNGYGEQPLYTVRVRLLTGGVERDAWERRIGLRTLGISRDKNEWGEEFCHIVNGVKVFAMGGDYIPEDNILSRVTPERTRRLLEDVKLANFNTVRIWGGGYYPDDFFYDICDELGLMVWQDFMFACAVYDLTPEFERSIRLEAVQNVKRLRHHASLALLCGNNEMEGFVGAALVQLAKGEELTFAPMRMSHIADYTKLYEYILPSICGEHAPQTFYWPSSPSSGGAFDEPVAPNKGDTHYWDVWHGLKPITEYRKFYFSYVSEFGFQSFPCAATVNSFTLPEDRNIFSRIMERHQRNKDANGKILSYLSQTYLYPNGFDNLLYCSQILQADAIRYGVEHWRRNRGRCMGAVIWQINDCWPVASWSSIDYYGRWKALHYAAKRFFAPVLISAQEDGELSQNPQINEFHPTHIKRGARLNVSNETMADVEGVARWELRAPDGSVLQSGEVAIRVPKLSAVWLDELDFGDEPITERYLSYSLDIGGGIVSAGTALFCAPKHFAFADPRLSVRAEGDELVVTAEAYAKHVYIESEDADMLLDDNFFDMNPGERRIKVLRGTAKEPRVRSVYGMDK